MTLVESVHATRAVGMTRKKRVSENVSLTFVLRFFAVATSCDSFAGGQNDGCVKTNARTPPLAGLIILLRCRFA
jgi:hypothetical protein